MAAKHAFVDESLRGDYLLCAVIVETGHLTEIRRAMRGLCRPGQRRVHMHGEGNSRRRAILSTIADLNIRAHLVRGPLGELPARVARDVCLQVMVSKLVDADVKRLVLESCEQDHRDSQIIRQMVAKSATQGELTYLHMAPASEPLLWLPDIVAWAFGRGGDWQRRTTPVVETLTNVEP